MQMSRKLDDFFLSFVTTLCLLTCLSSYLSNNHVTIGRFELVGYVGSEEVKRKKTLRHTTMASSNPMGW